MVVLHHHFIDMALSEYPFLRPTCSSVVSCFSPIRLSIGRRLQRLPRHRSPVPFFVGRTDSDPTSFWKALWLGEGVPVGGWGHGRNSPKMG